MQNASIPDCLRGHPNCIIWVIFYFTSIPRRLIHRPKPVSLRPPLLQLQDVAHRVHNALLHVPKLPSWTEYLVALAHVPPARIHAFGHDSIRRALKHAIFQLREVLANQVHHELRRDEPRDGQDALIGGGRSGKGQDVGASNIADINLGDRRY